MDGFGRRTSWVERRSAVGEEDADAVVCDFQKEFGLVAFRRCAMLEDVGDELFEDDAEPNRVFGLLAVPLGYLAGRRDRRRRSGEGIAPLF